MTDWDPRALAVLERLEGAGFRAVLVGGCVRDSLLGLAPHDYDAATSALPEQVEAACSGPVSYTHLISAEWLRLLCSPGAGDILLDFPEAAVQVVPELGPCVGFDQRNPYHCWDVYTSQQW